MSDPRQILDHAHQEIQRADALVAEVERRKAERRRGDSSDTPKLRCPACGEYLSRVTNTRVVGNAGDPTIRRRRECGQCGARFATLERVISGSLVKKTA